jgi:hypothetical protein
MEALAAAQHPSEVGRQAVASRAAPEAALREARRQVVVPLVVAAWAVAPAAAACSA